MAEARVSTSTRSMWIALAGYAVLFAGKLATYFVTHIGVMFAEAMHSAADMLIASFLLVAAYISAKPADEEFRFGYGRAQNVAALVAATIFISFTALETLREAIPKLIHPAENTGASNFGLAIVVILVSMVISAVSIFSILREKNRGAASKAQLIDVVNDEVTLAAALVGIVLVSRGMPLADPIASIAVAIVIAFNAVVLWRENALRLIGHSPDDAFYERVNDLVFSVPGVLAIHNVIAEQVGEQIHLTLHIEVEPGMSIENADAIADAVEAVLRHSFADIFVTAHVDPAGIGSRRGRVEAPSTSAGART